MMPEAPSQRSSQRLKSERIQQRVEALAGWSFTPDGRSIHFQHRSQQPMAALQVLRKIIAAAQEHGVAPRITHTLGTVEVTLWDPEVGAVTDRELDLAETINRLVGDSGA